MGKYFMVFVLFAAELTCFCHILLTFRLRVAKDVERIVRESCATPATVAIMAGKIHVGMYG